MSSPSSGTHICSYFVKASYPGKQPFLIGTFKIPRASTFTETEAAAENEMVNAVAEFFKDHFPDDVKPPVAAKAMLGSVVFVPDDFEWRRTR